MRPKRQPKPSGGLLDSFFARHKLTREAREYRALYAWHCLAGPRFGKRVRPERIWGQALVLRLASAAWANELGYLRHDLLSRLRGTPGGEWIEELRFTVGPLDELPSWDEVGERPPPRSMARPTAPPFDDAPVLAALQQISDPELRAALTELYARARHQNGRA